MFRVHLIRTKHTWIGINNPNRINLPSPRPQRSLFSLSLIHIFAIGSALRADLFYWDGLHYDVSPKWVISLDHNKWTIMDHNLWSMNKHEMRFDLIKIMTGSFPLRHQNTLVSPRKMEDYLKSILIGWIHLVWVKTFWNGKWTPTITRMNIQLGLQSPHRFWAIFELKISAKNAQVVCI